MSYLESHVDYLYQQNLLPTPTADDNPQKNTGKRNQDGLQKRAYQTTGKTSQLNPRFVAEMMGFPTDWTILPFQNGETKA
jgi:ABC-type Fe3+-citrate transport system substrate-binding protein